MDLSLQLGNKETVVSYGKWGHRNITENALLWDWRPCSRQEFRDPWKTSWGEAWTNRSCDCDSDQRTLKADVWWSSQENGVWSAGLRESSLVWDPAQPLGTRITSSGWGSWQKDKRELKPLMAPFPIQRITISTHHWQGPAQALGRAQPLFLGSDAFSQGSA